MRAIVYENFGSPDALELRQVETPAPGSDEVLVKVHATSINSWDWELLTGKLQARLFGGGLFRPKDAVLGGDFAGRVEAVGANVTRFKPGDAVLGDKSGKGWGALAEYVCVAEDLLAMKSPAMSFEEAAATPQAGLLALQGLRDIRKIEPGQKVLINGAGGGCGTFAIQLAKMYGAEVTAVDSEAKFDVMSACGADHLVDYKIEDYTRSGERYDFIIDAVARHSIFDYARALKPAGVFVIVGGATMTVLQLWLLRRLLSNKDGRDLQLLMWRPSSDDLSEMTTLFEAGKVKPVIDKTYPLEDAAEAFRRIEDGRVKGKAVVTMQDRGAV